MEHFKEAQRDVAGTAEWSDKDDMQGGFEVGRKVVKVEGTTTSMERY